MVVFPPFFSQYVYKDPPSSGATTRAADKYGPIAIAKCCKAMMIYQAGHRLDRGMPMCVICLIGLMTGFPPLREGFMEEGVYGAYFSRTWDLIRKNQTMEMSHGFKMYLKFYVQ